MVENAVDPIAPDLAVVTAAHQRRVLPRHGGLIAIAVERPGLDLALVQLAAMQKGMKRMLVVIALGADGAELLLEFLGTHDLGHGLILTSTRCLKRNIK